MGILVWKDDIKKIMTEEERQIAGLNDSGISWIKNMSDADAEKWVAKLYPKARRIEIQKSIRGVNLKIIVSKAINHPRLFNWCRKYWQLHDDEYIISIGQNGTSFWTSLDLVELMQVITESKVILNKLEV